GSCACRRDHVVAARVPDARQRIVLAQDRDGGPTARSDRCPESGRHAGDTRLDLEALPVQELAEPGAGLDFLVGELRMIVDPTRERLALVSELLHRLCDRVLDRAHGVWPPSNSALWLRYAGSVAREGRRLNRSVGVSGAGRRSRGLDAEEVDERTIGVVVLASLRRT